MVVERRGGGYNGCSEKIKVKVYGKEIKKKGRKHLQEKPGKKL